MIYVPAMKHAGPDEGLLGDMDSKHYLGEISSGGKKTYMSQMTQDFLKAWGICHRLSSTYYLYSNTRAELGVKSMKRLLQENTGPLGHLDTDRFASANV